MSLVLIITGNYLPKIKANSVVGVRAPWINKNPTVWAKTQRISGIPMVITGLINLVICFFPFGKYVFVITVGTLVIFMLVYSIVVAKQESKKIKQEETKDKE